MFASPKSLFRTLAFCEAVTWTLLIAGLILRASLGWSLAVTIGGGIHGFVFLAYAGTALLVSRNQRWSAPVTVLALASAVVPYATVPTERALMRRGRLEGAWRLEAGGDPRDARVDDRVMRWMLRHPIVLTALTVTAVALLFTVLLIIGPPGGRH